MLNSWYRRPPRPCGLLAQVAPGEQIGSLSGYVIVWDLNTSPQTEDDAEISPFSLARASGER